MSKNHFYPLIDKDGVEWRLDGARPISAIADRVKEVTPSPTTNEQMEGIKSVLDSGMFPDLMLKPE